MVLEVLIVVAVVLHLLASELLKGLESSASGAMYGGADEGEALNKEMDKVTYKVKDMLGLVFEWK